MPSDPASLRRAHLEAARDAATPTVRLDRLAASKDAEVRAAVAENPNASVSTLMRLADELPEAVAKNPVLPLLLLTGGETPLEHDRIGRMMGRLLKGSTDPAFLREHASSSFLEARKGVAENPATPVDVLDVLAVDDNETVRRNVSMNPSVSVETLTRFARRGRTSTRNVVLSNPRLPVTVMKELIADPRARDEVFLFVALNPAAPLEVVEEAYDRMSGHYKGMFPYYLRQRREVSDATLEWALRHGVIDDSGFARLRALHTGENK